MAPAMNTRNGPIMSHLKTPGVAVRYKDNGIAHTEQVISNKGFKERLAHIAINIGRKNIIVNEARASSSGLA